MSRPPISNRMGGGNNAWFVMVVGGDKPDNNLKVFDIRENAAVRSRFGDRELKNPLSYSNFGFNTANEAEVPVEIEPININRSSANILKDPSNSSKSADVEMTDSNNSFPKPTSGGAAKKFLNKKKKKKKKEF